MPLETRENNSTQQQERTTQLGSRNETTQLVSRNETTHLNRRKQLNSSVGTKQLNSALPSTACNRLQPPTTAYDRLQPPATACNRLQPPAPPAPPLQQNRLFLPTYELPSGRVFDNFLSESEPRVAAIVGDHHCHTPRH
ncbi:hypothetical protein TNCV_4667041 [Trichonephila clavipes]|nr:hypothetical protein TNCV_4667041 [Trichonephila clavipes]